MIIFDTNALRGMSLTGSVAAMLVAIASDAGQELAISAVTEDEYRSARRREYEQRLERAHGSLKSLRKLVPNWQPPDLNFPTADSFLEIDLERAMEMFKVLPLKGEHAIEALRREADRMLPASQVAEPGTGARDVAIWLTAIEQSASSGQPVYLVSADSSAFGRKSLHDELASEASAKSAEVILCPSVANLLDNFATKIDAGFDVTALLEGPKVARSIAEFVQATTFFEAAASLPGDDSLVETAGFLESGGLQDLSLRNAADVQAYEVRGWSWIAVRGVWSARRNMIRKLSGATIIEDWDVELEQRLSLLIRATNDGKVRGVEVVGLSPARAKANKKSVTVQLGTAHETDTAFPFTIGEPESG